MDNFFSAVKRSAQSNLSHRFDGVDDMNNQYFADFEEFGEDETWDKLLDPHSRRSFPAPKLGDRVPPPIGYGEVTTNTKTRRQIGLANLRQNRDRGNRGNAGLAVVNRSGEVIYTVFNPRLDRVLWRGLIGRLTVTGRRTPQGREDGVRRVLAQSTNQTFALHPVHRSGPDLRPELPQSQARSRQPAQPQRTRSTTASQQRRSRQRVRSEPIAQPIQLAATRPTRATAPQRRTKPQRNRFDTFAEFY